MPDETKWVRVDPNCPDPEPIQKAGKIINHQGLVIFPTQTLYGLAADALNPGAVKQIFSLKQRPAEKPLLILVNSRDDIPPLVRHIPQTAEILMDNFWPGSLTLVFEASPALPSVLTGKTGKIGIRLPAHPVARALVLAAGTPVTGTSANLSGQPGCKNPSWLCKALIDGVHLILDAGPLKGGAGSTVLDLTTDPPALLREGTIPILEIHNTLKPPW